MATLYLLRHGIAVPGGTPGFADEDRPLTPLGRNRVREIARGFARLEPRLDLIITSPLPRARETAEILAERMEMVATLEVSDVLHMDRDAEEIAHWLIARSEPNLMLVGHNPNLSDLVAFATTGRVVPGVCSLRRGGIAAMSKNADGRYELDWLARPRLLRRLGK